MKLSILIPVYNEEKMIDRILAKVLELRQSSLFDSLEIIAVDDCSKDNSFNLLNEYAEKGEITLARHSLNKGKGGAIKTAIALSTGDYIVFQDADLEYDPQDLLKMAEFVDKNGLKVLYGSRFSGKNTSPLGKFHYFVNAGLTTFSNFFTELNLTDMETCYKMFHKDILKEIVIEENRFGIEPEITAKVAKLCKEKGYKITEIPISYNPRNRGEGKKIGVKDGLRALYIILKYGLF